MKKTVIAMIALMGLGIGSVSADDSDAVFGVAAGATVLTILQPSPQAWAGGVVLAMLNNGNTYASDCPKEVYDAPNVLAKRPGESYNFEVSACHFKLNSDKLVRVE